MYFCMRIPAGPKLFADALQRWPWPEDCTLPDVSPFTFTLDGGGRHLIQTVLQNRTNSIFAEFGTFMGGAARTWLSNNIGLRYVCVDPWGDDITDYVKSLSNVDWAARAYKTSYLEEIAELLSRYGPLRLVQNNLASFKDRCVLIRGRIPAAYSEMRSAGLVPDIIYIDALKRHEDFVEAHKIFPNAIITGDDWNWGIQADGAYPIRPYVEEIARERNGQIYADRATFVISEPRHELQFDDKWRYMSQSSA